MFGSVNVSAAEDAADEPFAPISDDGDGASDLNVGCGVSVISPASVGDREEVPPSLVVVE